jgi:hypothetical protein
MSAVLGVELNLYKFGKLESPGKEERKRLSGSRYPGEQITPPAQDLFRRPSRAVRMIILMNSIFDLFKLFHRSGVKLASLLVR